MFLANPLLFIENQCTDLLESIAELTTTPHIERHFHKVRFLQLLTFNSLS
jgi:hypothetical protein